MADRGALGKSADTDTSALAAGRAFGLFPAADFRLTDGRCRDCPTTSQALWYFQSETIAVPQTGRPVASFGTGVSVATDLRAWLAGRDPASPPEYPPLVWVAAPDVVSGARLSPDTTTLESPAGSLRVALVPKIALNRSYFDATSAAFFARRTVKARGRVDNGTIVVRTLWPEDFRLPRVPPAQALANDEPAPLALRALMRAVPAGGATGDCSAATLWQRNVSAHPVPPGRAVLAMMVNGAQGDDDEAHAGHFALKRDESPIKVALCYLC